MTVLLLQISLFTEPQDFFPLEKKSIFVPCELEVCFNKTNSVKNWSVAYPILKQKNELGYFKEVIEKTDKFKIIKSKFFEMDILGVGMVLPLTLRIFLNFRNSKLSSLNDDENTFREILHSSLEDSCQMKMKKIILCVMGQPNHSHVPS